VAVQAAGALELRDRRECRLAERTGLVVGRREPRRAQPALQITYCFAAFTA
jgi:hypothetical protein